MSINASRLSERELEILRLVATGASNKAIAQQLSISSNTVKVHLRNIFEKIHVESRTEAAMLAVSSGLVPGYTLTGSEAGSLPAEEQVVPPAEAEIAAQPITTPQASRNRLLWAALILGGIAVLVAVIYLMWTMTRPTTAETPVAAELAWKPLADMPTARYGFATAAYQDRIYAIGGETGSGVIGSLEVYDVETNRWESRSAKPVPVTDIQAAVLGGKIYVPAGRQESGEASNLLEIYDPVTDQWSLGKPLPVETSGYALAEYEGKLYLFGGMNGSGVLSTVQAYDPDLDQWSLKSPLPTPVTNAGVSVVGGKIYLLGGSDGKQVVDQVATYSPGLDNGQDNPWSSLEFMPEKRQQMGSASTLEVIYLVGGTGAQNQPLPTQAYLTTSGQWQTILSAPAESWTRMGVVANGNYLYALGGKVGEAASGNVQSIQVVYITVLPFVP
jgi:DNA-binding CsgD family transcriptional regulator